MTTRRAALALQFCTTLTSSQWPELAAERDAVDWAVARGKRDGVEKKETADWTGMTGGR